MNSSSIEWTARTWNPMQGCTKASPECANCYAESFAERFKGTAGHPYEHGFKFRLVPDRLPEPLKLAKPQMIFVNSMSDIFHHEAPTEYLQKIAWVMQNANWHVFQVLTKRPERMRDLLSLTLRDAAKQTHIWWGVSVGNRKHGLPRIDLLRESGAMVKWLSIEPLLEDLGELDLSGIDWVVVGGESGPGARPIKQEWVDSIQQQCKQAQVPFFFKQWGGVKKSAAGRDLNGKHYNEMPPVIVAPVADERTRKQHLETVYNWVFESTTISQEETSGERTPTAMPYERRTP